jgi:manganese/zinc/iron transport system permease protein
MLEELLALLPGNHTARVVVITAGLIGATGGALGCFAVLRKRALLGDVLAHAALPGLVGAAMITGSRSPLVLALGALGAGIAASILSWLMVRVRGVREDSALAIVLAGSFGLGLMLLSMPGDGGTDVRAGLERYLLGQAGSTLVADLSLALAGFVVVIGTMVLFWKEFQLLAFDSDSAASQGFPVRRLDAVLSGLLAGAIVIGLSMVGVVLMTAVIVAPAIAARPLARSLGPMVVISAVVGAASGVTGALISASIPRMPTGPVVALVLAAVVLVIYIGAAVRQKLQRGRALLAADRAA